MNVFAEPAMFKWALQEMGEERFQALSSLVCMRNLIPGITHIHQENEDLLCDLPVQSNQLKHWMKLITTIKNWNQYASVSEEVELDNVSII